MKKIVRIAVFWAMAFHGLAVLSQMPLKSKDPSADGKTASAAQDAIASKVLDFQPVELESARALSPATVFPPQCSANGGLFLHMINVKNLREVVVLEVRGRKTQTYASAAITDLNDVTVNASFPSDSGLDFLVYGSKEKPGERGPGKSAAGIPRDTYHSFIARFRGDGTYEGATQLSVDFQLTRFAEFPTGDFLVAGYDRTKSLLRVLYVNSSGEPVRTVETPAARHAADGGAEFGSLEGEKAARTLVGSVYFTAHGQSILVWRHDSNDSIVEVGPGGSVREVPLQVPSGYWFADMLTANDRWVAHFRSQGVPAQAQMSTDLDTYFELRPQDASVSAKLVQKGVVPLSIACENDGAYIAFKQDDKGNLLLLKAR